MKSGDVTDHGPSWRTAPLGVVLAAATTSLAARDQGAGAVLLPLLMLAVGDFVGLAINREQRMFAARDERLQAGAGAVSTPARMLSRYVRRGCLHDLRLLRHQGKGSVRSCRS